MKKVLSLLLACIMVFSLCACGSDDKLANKTGKFDNDAKGTVPSADAVSFESGTADKKDGDYMVDVSGAKEAEMDKGVGYTIADIAGMGAMCTVPVTVYNMTDYSIANIFIAANDDPCWGDDLLGVNTIIDYSYGSIYMTVYGCATEYDVCIVLSDGRTLNYSSVNMGSMMTSGFSMLISQENGMRMFLEN